MTTEYLLWLLAGLLLINLLWSIFGFITSAIVVNRNYRSYDRQLKGQERAIDDAQFHIKLLRAQLEQKTPIKGWAVLLNGEVRPISKVPPPVRKPARRKK